ncbi:MAG TPA: SPOR domain-containing protein, partial [Sphingomonas sp.]|nr:SPOR domain-containing protein [Sphingomonas sp.]
QYVYGTALFNGDLVGRDWPKAYALMTRAAAAGLPQATTSLAQMDKYLAPEDKKKGLELANQLAARPMPPISRQALTSPGPVLPPTRTAEARPAPVPARAVPAPKAAKIESARPAPAKLASAGGKWQVQLGAFSTEASAEAAWRKISGKSAALRSLHPSYEKAGAVVRLRAGPLADRSAAEKACADAKAAGAGCFPVAP